MRSQPTRAAWIEIMEKHKKSVDQAKSQPTRAAWIEIPAGLNSTGAGDLVAAHSGCVD